MLIFVLWWVILFIYFPKYLSNVRLWNWINEFIYLFIIVIIITIIINIIVVMIINYYY